MMDIDGTLIKPFYAPESSGERGTEITAEDYLRVELLPGRLERIEQLNRVDPHACYALITNQGGVAFGFQTRAMAEQKLGRVCVAVDFFGSRPMSVHVCYTHPKATNPEYLNKDDPRRKPGCGMLDEAFVRHRIRSRETALYVGDLEVDEKAAAAIGIPFFYADSFF